MAKTRFISLLLVFMLILSAVPQFVFAADNEKEYRTVYLHAQGENPQSTPNVSTVYLGDTVDVYLAVDDPNKGKYENDTHLEPQYDMNGYTVKIYFDPAFFDFESTSKTAPSTPIDYTIPDKSLASSGTGDGNDTGNLPENTVGYYIYSLGSGSAVVKGKTYKTAYATIFFSGNFVPQRKDGQLWYNLCSLPLRPLKTGSSDVFIEIDSSDEHSLELFAKNVSDDYEPNFKFTAINGGYHHITIKDKLKPASPVADPVSGTYTDAQKVTLTAEDGCDIYYSDDGGVTYSKYTAPIDVERSMEIFAYAERKADGKLSNTVSFEYKIIPNPPYLFDSDKKPISNVYTDSKAFEVYVSDKTTYGDIEDDSEVYYTFGDVSIDDFKTDGTDPETEWVRITKGDDLQKIEINKRRTVKLVTVKSSVYGSEFSDISWYYLGIKPSPVTANPESGLYTEKKTVTLSTETPDAQIFYTIDGKDPRTDGILYTIPLTFNKDVTLRAAALYDGQWSELSSYWYVFNLEDDYGVDAFYPSGVYEGEVNVTLTPNNPDNYVIYSTDGGNTWNVYEDTIAVSRDTEILAKAVDKNGKEGEEYKFTYTIKPLPPQFAPESTQFTNADKISIYCVERTDDNYSRYELYYTLDGSDPTTSRTAIKADDVSDSAEIHISDYTVVTAVVKRDGTTYSSVVTHSYDIVVSKPVRPLTTLLPGYYTREIGSEPYTTQFVPVPTGTKIYYTISHGNGVMPDPVPGADGTFEYNGEEIDIEGRTIIKAVAVNSFGAKSDIGVFEYVITPEAPVAAPSATVGGNQLPVVPVDAVEGSTVKYEIGSFENEFVAENERFYINTATGNAYEDEDCTKPLGNKSNTTNNGTVVLHISAELDGISSEPNTYVYSTNNRPESLASPYADKETGTYEEINSDGKNNFLVVSLYSLNDGDEIQYMKDNSGIWETYTEPLPLKADIVLQLRAKKGDYYSAVSTYVYEFVPLAPIITLPSGRYSTVPTLPTTKLKLDSRAPTDVNYSIMYRANGDENDVRYREGTEREIEHTMSFKAYVINEDTGKKSKNTIHYYIIESNAISGSVYTAYPYEVNPGDTRYIGTHMLSQKDYNEGIKLYTQNKDAKIRYFYTYTKADGSGTAASETYTYDNATPIFVNSSMKDISITAWLIDKDGNEIEDSTSTFNYVFVSLEIPKPSLEDVDKTEFPKNTEYTIRNDYKNNENIMIYYTLDGTDPADSSNQNRILYNEETLKLTESTTVKTVYFHACGGCGQCKNDNPQGCTRGVYGETGTYKYTVPTKTGGGGGGGGGGGTITIDKTRKYTKDIFGNEHPTHIGYIKGYPDGSVQPEGNITREEMTAILYRIKNKSYESPFISTGEVFPDVKANRWSVTEIEYMANKGYVTGYPEGDFRPSQNLTRAEFAALIFRFTEIEDKGIENKFTDFDSSHWAYDEVMALCRAGLMEGYEDNTFRAGNYITRAEVMTVVNKILGRNPSPSYVKSLDFNPFNDLEIQKWYYVAVLEATITHNYYLDDKDVEYKWEDWK